MENQYSKYKMDFSDARFISASEKSLESINRPKEENFPDALYIWPFGCVRFHFFRLFNPEKEINKVEVAFLSDNLFDVWLNGVNIAQDVKHLELKDVTSLVKNGENNLHIRGYQSGTDESFSSAITGGIRIYYKDGEIAEILTDGEFKQVLLVDFWDNEEPENFEIETVGRTLINVNVMKMHPIASRRSFYFTRKFFLDEKPVCAYLYSSALGCYEPYMNGKKIEESFFIPFCSNYEMEYQKFDILPFLKKGDNKIGIITGNGTYNCRSWGQLYAKKLEVIAIMELVYEDGRKEYIYTDEDWKCAPSPLVNDDIQYGERYDARLEIDGWCNAENECPEFVNVCARENTEHKSLLYQEYPYIKKMKEYDLKEYKILPDNSFMYDVGVCIAGRVSVTFKNLQRGKKVRIRYCERLTKNGTPENGAYATVYYPNDCSKGGRSEPFMRNMDVYIAKGEAKEVYECRFAYTGFRYVWIEGLDSAEDVAELTAFELHNDLENTGEIYTENQALNSIFNVTKRSWLNNIFNGPTDCPTREKNYWNGDMQIFSHSACWLTDNSKLLARWTDNGIKMHDGPYAWEDETYILPLTLYKFYGDKKILEARYPKMLELIEKRTEFDGMLLPEKDSHQYCDWLSPTGITPDKKFFGGCWHYYMLKKIADVAEILGDFEKCDELRKKAVLTRDEFNRKYLVDGGSDYAARNQCGIVLPLAFGIAPEENRQTLAATLAKYMEKEDYHVTTGFIGTRYIFEVLADYGYSDVAYKVITNNTFPSWLDMIASGVTAISESWYGENDPDGSISMSHFSLGSIIGWFFEYLGGIRINESEPGLKKIVLKPIMIKEFGSFGVSYKTKYGEIKTHWHFEGDKPVFTYAVPNEITVVVNLE